MRLDGIAFGNGLFVAIGGMRVAANGGTRVVPGLILTSPDGEVWTRQTTPLSASESGIFLNDITCRGGWFVAVGDRGTILFSADGVQWFAAGRAVVETLRAVAYAEGGFIATGAGGITLVSEDFRTVRMDPLSFSEAGFRLMVRGPSGQMYRVQATTDLALPWEDIGTVALENSSGIFVDSSAANFRARFYRAVEP